MKVVEDGNLIQVEIPVQSPVAASKFGSDVSHLDSKLYEFMFETRNNNKLLLKKLDEVAEKNKFWKDLVLGLHTLSSAKSSHILPSPTHGSVTLPANLQDICVVAGKKLAKEYGLEDLVDKGIFLTEVNSKAIDSDPGIPVQAAEDKGDTEDVKDDA